MKNWFKIFPLILVLLMGFQINDSYGQYYGKKKKKKKKPTTEKEAKVKKDIEGTFADHLWYGGGLNIGFSGNNNLSVFNFGISPMVGYKIIEPVSVGPRVALNYSYIKGIGTDGRQKKIQPLSFEYGLFARYKFIPFLFTHIEFGIQNEEFIGTSGNLIAVDPQTGDPITVREQSESFSLGIGYTSDSIFGYEIMLLYNFLEPDDSLDLPFDIRVGFNYRF